MPAPPEPDVHDPRDLLLECHARIRRFSQGLVLLAAAEDLDDPRVEATARSCHRYFDQALPLHAADEDETLAPRLLALALDPAARAAVIRMQAEHPQVEQARDLALPVLLALAEGARPTRSDRQAGLLPLAELLARHIDAEEAAVFPLVDRLDPGTWADMRAEMHARRGL